MHSLLQSVYGTARKAVSKEQMVPLLYRGAHRWILEALEQLRAQQWDQAADRVSRAQAVLTELWAGVDRTVDPELAGNLGALYDYWVRQLSLGLVRQDPAPLEEVAGYLDDLALAWEEAAKKVRADQFGATLTNGRR